MFSGLEPVMSTNHTSPVDIQLISVDRRVGKNDNISQIFLRRARSSFLGLTAGLLLELFRGESCLPDKKQKNPKALT